MDKLVLQSQRVRPKDKLDLLVEMHGFSFFFIQEPLHHTP
jgi:hypothetical protein